MQDAPIPLERADGVSHFAPITCRLPPSRARDGGEGSRLANCGRSGWDRRLEWVGELRAEGRGAAASERSGGGDGSGPASARERIGWCGGEDKVGKKRKRENEDEGWSHRLHMGPASNANGVKSDIHPSFSIHPTKQKSRMNLSFSTKHKVG